MSNDKSNNKRIAKNTLILYFRMFLLMALGLYTSRINLISLGIESFGVYNVVAGFIVMFSSITGSLGNAISRFLMVELGLKDYHKLKMVFSTAINVQLLFGIIIVVIGEVAGLWFLNNKMQIPSDSMYAATWVLHMSIIQFVVGLVIVPFNATVVSHENMGAFAYLSLFEAAMKLFIAFSIFITPYDKLITFVSLILLNQFLTLFIYVFYCVGKFNECRYTFAFDKKLLKEISGFAGWNFIPNAAYVLNIQGTNILMNVFFGVVVNAARGVSNQVNNALNQFINNFMTAVVPQIMKSYASGDKQAAFKLACRSAKYSYFLMFVLSLPILLETDIILDIWLKTPPDYSVSFVRWQQAASLTMVFGHPLFNLMMADGRMKKFQMIISTFTVCPFILSWVLFQNGLPVITGYIIYFLIYLTLIPIRFFLVKNATGLSSTDYLGGVVLKTVFVSVCALIIPLATHLTLPYGFTRLIVVAILSILCTVTSIYFVGLTENEQIFFKSKLNTVLVKLSKRNN